MKGKRFSTIDKRKIKIRAGGDTKERSHKCIISERGYFEGDKIVIDK